MSTSDKIKSIICELKHVDMIDENFELIESGYLDSFAVMHLLTEVEKEFNISIPIDLITPENFNTPENIAKLIDSII